MNRNTCDPRRLELFLRERLPEEHQRDIEAHLSVCPACRSRLDDWAGGAAWWTEIRQHLGGDGAAEVSHAALSPRGLGVDLYFLQPSDRSASLGRLGPYEVLEILGRGGFGIVLKAFDPALHRPVAIKVLAPEFAVSGAARKRFAREAQAAAAVCHDHVVPVHAVDADATPPYLVMAFIHGQSLQQRLDKSGALELKEILRIGMQTAQGLAAAHAQGLVHRDIKPANIMLENGVERVRITDFGLARAVDDASVSQSGALSGTPQYMSPEQATCATVDQRSDLFALGSTLYAMCTGLPPFRGSPCLAVLKQVCESEPEPIQSRNPDIPPWLAGIIRKLHAKDPGQRFASAGEVAELLERCLAHVQQPTQQPLPAQAAELGRPQRPKRAWPQPNRNFALVLLLAAIAGGSYFLWPRGERTPNDVTPSRVEPESLESLYGSENEVWTGTSGVQSRVQRMQQELHTYSTEMDLLNSQLQWARQRALLLGQPWHSAEDENDPLAARLGSLRDRVQRLEQSGNFPEPVFNRPLGESR